ncbi:MAG TPA: Ig-like domain-containing protein [Saprospiraceae bacterium]|nr:Ig-like domain-containing protein [Saprospiraceae bacterium]HPN67892.1 Ig-like domain-containing protein [Saprospiraceae bacterium]
MNKYWFLFFGLCFSFWQCASSGSLGGGPKDKEPPKIVLAESSPNFQTNFSGRSFELTFDEFVVLRDPIKQIVVSPPLTYIPEVRNRGKKILFRFNEKEIVRDSTTYTVNFGEAIQDLHENNKLINYRYVFSTGDIIDSLSVKGTVNDALTSKPVENVTVMLYNNLQDSAYIKEKPFYFARTAKDGTFSIENIKRDTFRIFAVLDENVSYTYNEGVESLGYNDTLITFSDSSNVFVSNLALSKPLGNLRIFDSESKNLGLFKIKFNRPLDAAPSYKILNDSLRTYAFHQGDSLMIWYQANLLAQDSVLLLLDSDTLNLKIPDTSTVSRMLKLTNLTNNTFLSNYDTIKVKLSNPGFLKNAASVALVDSSGRRLPLQTNSTDNIVYQFTSADNLLSKQYTFRIDSAAFEDIFGNVSDSLSVKFNKIAEDKLSGLVAVISKLDSLSKYVVSLEDNGGSVRKTLVEQVSSITLTYAGLKPGAYKIVIIKDLNGNNRWDAVDFWNKRQAEITKSFTVENLRENWTVETEISFEE